MLTSLVVLSVTSVVQLRVRAALLVCVCLGGGAVTLVCACCGGEAASMVAMVWSFIVISPVRTCCCAVLLVCMFVGCWFGAVRERLACAVSSGSSSGSSSLACERMRRCLCACTVIVYVLLCSLACVRLRPL